jgi:effector-binding domain-containing protein
MEYGAHRIQMEPSPTAVVRGEVAVDAIAAFLAAAFGEVMQALADQGAEPAGPPFACYRVRGDSMLVEAGFPCQPAVGPVGRVEAGSLPGGQVLLVMHRGSYDTVDRAYAAAAAWLAENEWEAAGEPWEAYLDGPEVAVPRTLVHMPCRPV